MTLLFFRKLDVLAITTSTIDMVAAESRAIREPRVVQKTTKVGIFLILIVGASKVRRMLKEIQIQCQFNDFTCHSVLLF
jgi:hypothetical protein